MTSIKLEQPPKIEQREIEKNPPGKHNLENYGQSHAKNIIYTYQKLPKNQTGE